MRPASLSRGDGPSADGQSPDDDGGGGGAAEAPDNGQSPAEFPAPFPAGNGSPASATPSASVSVSVSVSAAGARGFGRSARPALLRPLSEVTAPVPRASRSLSSPSCFLSFGERRHTLGFGGSGAGDSVGNAREQSGGSLITMLERRKEFLRRQLEQGWTEMFGKNIFALVRSSNASRLQHLLEQKLCNVNERDYNGGTPLHVAALEGNQSIVRVLISFGADVMATDKRGSTPLDWAAANRHSGVFRYLLTVTRYLQQQQKEHGNARTEKKFSDESLGDGASASLSNQLYMRSRNVSLFMRRSSTQHSLNCESPSDAPDPRPRGSTSVNNAFVLASLPPDVASVFRHEAEQKHKQAQSPLDAPTTDADDNELIEEMLQSSETSPDMDFGRFSSYTTVYDTTSVVVCMVGLPGRGKSFICKRLSRYLNWKGVACRVFNAGQYRRKILGVEGTNEAAFYDPNNSLGKEMRERMADLACDDLMDFIALHKCAVGVFDATNTTRARRSRLAKFFTRAAKQRGVECRVIFIESICTDDTIITENILRAKCGNDDFKDVTDTVEVISSFRSRIAQYEKVYEALDPSEGLSYMQIVNVKRHVILNNIPYGLPTRITFFLMNLHPVACPAYIALPGETESDHQHLYGGDRRLTAHGRRYSQALKRFIQERYVPHMAVLHGTNPDVLNTLKPLAEGAGVNFTTSSLSSLAVDEMDEMSFVGGSNVSYPAKMLCQLPELDAIHYGRFCGRSVEWVRANYPKLSGLIYTAVPNGSADSLRSPTNCNTDSHVEEEEKSKAKILPTWKTERFEKSAMAVRRLRHVPNGTDPRLSYCVQFPNGESCRQVNVRLESVLMAVMRAKSSVFVVASAVPAQGVLAFLLDVLPELSPTLRVPQDTVVEIGVGGEVKVHRLLDSTSPNELVLPDS